MDGASSRSERPPMKLLLTSGGITNGSIREALIEMLGKPIEEAEALFVPTAQWGQPACSPQSVWRSTADRWDGMQGLAGLGWKSVGVLELTALPSIDRNRWEPWVRDADVLLVDGGEAVYLRHWMVESGLADLLPDARGHTRSERPRPDGWCRSWPTRHRPWRAAAIP